MDVTCGPRTGKTTALLIAMLNSIDQSNDCLQAIFMVASHLSLNAIIKLSSELLMDSDLKYAVVNDNFDQNQCQILFGTPLDLINNLAAETWKNCKIFADDAEKTLNYQKVLDVVNVAREIKALGMMIKPDIQNRIGSALSYITPKSQLCNKSTVTINIVCGDLQKKLSILEDIKNLFNGRKAIIVVDVSIIIF